MLAPVASAAGPYTNPAQITYTSASGTARSLAATLSDEVNAKSIGAKGDGAADDGAPDGPDDGGDDATSDADAQGDAAADAEVDASVDAAIDPDGGGDADASDDASSTPDAAGDVITNPCDGVTCATPPSRVCFDGSTLRTYGTSGTCSGGTCSYAPTDVPCAYGCVADACNGDPCAGVTCAMPPSSRCLDASTRCTVPLRRSDDGVFRGLIEADGLSPRRLTAVCLPADRLTGCQR
jgi:hypothetical protein